MFESKIKLNSLKEVQDFNKAIQSVSSDVDIKAGRIEIDAKSIMGLFALDLSKPLIINANTSDELAISQLEAIVSKFAL